MNPITFHSTSTHTCRINLFNVIPSRLENLTLPEIEQLPIDTSEGSGRLGDWFNITDGDRSSVTFIGDLSHCDSVGGGLENGSIVVNGNVGDFLADRMKGGTLTVSGSAGRFACSSLRGGLVTVAGDCGEYAAAAAPGALRGMNGGTLVIQGNCDQWLATRMRRGTVIVHGDVSAACANRMIAGTLVLCGQVAFPLAAQMSRGTIVLLCPTIARNAPAGFTYPENTELSFLRILLSDIGPHLPPAYQVDEFPKTVWRSVGDRVNSGLGEIIWGTIHAADNNKLMAHA
jgi:formylmethanofuran dehydrogenase subunit C